MFLGSKKHTGILDNLQKYVQI